VPRADACGYSLNEKENDVENTPARTGEADARPDPWGIPLAQARAEVPPSESNQCASRLHYLAGVFLQ
jgi:hypothetical protein